MKSKLAVIVVLYQAGLLVLDDVLVLESQVCLHHLEAVSLLLHHLADCRSHGLGLEDCLVGVSVGFLESRIDREQGDADVGAEFNVFSLGLSPGLQDILALYLSVLDLVLESIGERQGAQLEVNDFVLGRLGDPLLEILLHLLLDHGPVLEEVIRGEVARGVADGVDGYPSQNCLLLGSVASVDGEDLVLQHSVLERGLKIKLQAVVGSTLDHWKSGIGSLGELNGVELDVVPLEAVAQTDKLYTVFVCLVLDGLEPTTVVQSNLSVAQHGERGGDEDDHHKCRKRNDAADDDECSAHFKIIS